MTNLDSIFKSRDVTLSTKVHLVKAIYCHPAFLTYLQSTYIMWNTGLEEAPAGIKIARRNANNLRYADDTTLMAESEEELKSLLMKMKGEWKSWLKAQCSENYDHGIWFHHFMGNRWGRNLELSELNSTKSNLMKVKEESEKAGLKLNIQKTKIMASSPITSWQIDGETVETVSDFIFLGSKNHCRWWLQPWN